MLDSGTYTPSLRSPGRALCCRADGPPEKSLLWKIQGTQRGAEPLALHAPQRSPTGTWATGSKGQQPFLPSFLPISRSVGRASTMWSELTLSPQSPFLQYSHPCSFPHDLQIPNPSSESSPVLQGDPKPSPSFPSQVC